MSEPRDAAEKAFRSRVEALLRAVEGFEHSIAVPLRAASRTEMRAERMSRASKLAWACNYLSVEALQYLSAVQHDEEARQYLSAVQHDAAAPTVTPGEWDAAGRQEP